MNAANGPWRARIPAALVLAVTVLSAVLAPGAQARSQPAPVSGANMADPGVYLDRGSGRFYAFWTGVGLHEATAPTAGGPWTRLSDRLVPSSIPRWMKGDHGTISPVWAPDMIDTRRGFVIYFAVVLNRAAGAPVAPDKPVPDARCIGSAVSSSALGMFTADPRPVVCLPGYGASDDMLPDVAHRQRGQGVIDASPSIVTDNGARRLYLVYKTQLVPSTIRMVRLSLADGRTALGRSHELVHAPLSSTGYEDTVESPVLTQRGPWYVLFVSRGRYRYCDYSTAWFRSRQLWTWRSDASTELLTTADTGVCGPGGADVTAAKVRGTGRIFYHGWVGTNGAPPGGAAAVRMPLGTRRVMYANVLGWGRDGATPHVGRSLGDLR